MKTNPPIIMLGIMDLSWSSHQFTTGLPTTSSVEVLITTIQTVTQPKESQLPTNMAAVDISAETNQFLQYKVYRLV